MRLLAEQGLTVVSTARDTSRGQEAADKIRSSPSTTGKVLFHQLDVAKQDSVDAFSAWLKQELGRVTILVNNAGKAFGRPCLGLLGWRVTSRPWV